MEVCEKVLHFNVGQKDQATFAQRELWFQVNNQSESKYITICMDWMVLLYNYYNS